MENPNVMTEKFLGLWDGWLKWICNLILINKKIHQKHVLKRRNGAQEVSSIKKKDRIRKTINKTLIKLYN